MGKWENPLCVSLLFTVESYSRYLIREKNAQESASLLAGCPFLCIPFLYFWRQDTPVRISCIV